MSRGLRGLVVGAVLVVSLLEGQTLVPDRERITRLESLADLWGRLYLFHPRVAQEGIDLVGLLANAIPPVEAAPDAVSIATALNDYLLKPLGDPLTIARPTGRSDGASSQLSGKKLSPDVSYIDLSNPSLYSNRSFLNDLSRIFQDLMPAKTLVIDLRYPGLKAGLKRRDLTWLGMFLAAAAQSPFELRRVHQGWTQFNDPGDYHQQWSLSPGLALTPIQRPDTLTRSRYSTRDFSALPTVTVPTLFVANNSSYPYLRGLLSSLQAQDSAIVVWEQTGNFVDNPVGQEESPAPFGTFSFPGGVTIGINTALLLTSPDQREVNADLVAREHLSEEQILSFASRISSLSAARDGKPARLDMRFPVREPISMRELNRGERLAGLFQVWTVIRYLDPHKNLATGDWERILPEFIAKVENASSLRTFYEVMAELGARLNDAHTIVGHPSRVRGPCDIPARLERIEGRIIVTAVRGYLDAPGAPLRVGDEVLAIDDEPVDKIHAWWRARTSAATERVANVKIWPVGATTRGRAGSRVRLRIRSRSGDKSITLDRVPMGPWNQASHTCCLFDTVDPKAAWRRIGEIGVVELSQIRDVKEFESALAMLDDARGLILHGFPGFGEGPTELARRIINKPIPSVIYETPVRYAASPDTTGLIRNDGLGSDPLPTGRISKPVVVLTDGSYQSSSEGWIARLQQAHAITVVGTPTAGANGGSTAIILTGGGSFQFTGMNWLGSDGKRFENIGVVPDVMAEPTIEGVRNGRDEVLEKAIETLRTLMQR